MIYKPQLAERKKMNFKRIYMYFEFRWTRIIKAYGLTRLSLLLVTSLLALALFLNYILLHSHLNQRRRIKVDNDGDEPVTDGPLNNERLVARHWMHKPTPFNTTSQIIYIYRIVSFFLFNKSNTSRFSPNRRANKGVYILACAKQRFERFGCNHEAVGGDF